MNRATRTKMKLVQIHISVCPFQSSVGLLQAPEVWSLNPVKYFQIEEHFR